MPTTNDDLPSTLKKSSPKAQRTFIKTLESARKTYGDRGGRAYRVAYASLKHSFQKVGDRWVAKRRRGPSDERAAHGGPEPAGRTAGGVDVKGSSRKELERRAKKLGVKRRSALSKQELGEAIAKRERSRARRA